MKLATDLTASCFSILDAAKGPNGRKKKCTQVMIKTDCGKRVASRTIPGEWNPAAALKEFMRFPDRFTRHEFYGIGMAFIGGPAYAAYQLAEQMKREAAAVAVAV